jgi:hypothetical protein
MLITPRRAEIQAKVLAACRELLKRGEYPSGLKLQELCPGRYSHSLIQHRNLLVDRGLLSGDQLQALKSMSYGKGRPKRRDARRSAGEVTS